MGKSCSSGAGNSSRRLSRPGAAVDFLRGLQQQIGKGGMQIGAGQQFDGGADEVDIVRGDVFSKVNGALGQDQLGEVADAPGIAIGLGKIKKVDFGRVEELADQVRGGGIAHQEHGIRLAGEKGFGRVLGIQIGQLGGAAGFDAVELKEGQSQGARAAARGADGQPFAFQFGQDGQGGGAPIEDKKRFVGDAAQGNQRAAAGDIGHAALDEANIHAERWRP